MSATNHTTNYDLSQFVGTDKPSILSDYNGDMQKIDTAIKGVNTVATGAANTASTALTTAQGKQDTLTFDSTPTVGSSNPVTSEGIYNAIQGASADNVLLHQLPTMANPLDDTNMPTNKAVDAKTTTAWLDALMLYLETWLLPTWGFEPISSTNIFNPSNNSDVPTCKPIADWVKSLILESGSVPASLSQLTNSTVTTGLAAKLIAEMVLDSIKKTTLIPADATGVPTSAAVAAFLQAYYYSSNTIDGMIPTHTVYAISGGSATLGTVHVIKLRNTVVETSVSLSAYTVQVDASNRETIGGDTFIVDTNAVISGNPFELASGGSQFLGYAIGGDQSNNTRMCVFEARYNGTNTTIVRGIRYNNDTGYPTVVFPNFSYNL